MSLLAELDTTTPRSEKECRRFARRIDPWWRNVGVLAGCGPLLAFVPVDSLAAKLAALWAFVVIELYALRAHVRWRRRRFKLVHDLIRNGQVFDMVIVARGHSADNIIAFQMRHGGPTLVCGFDRIPDNVELKPGTTMEVLWSPPVSPVLACDDRGRVHVGHMHA